MTKAEWAALDRKLQFRAFTMAKLGTATEIETAKQILADAVEKGETYAGSWQTLKDSLGGNPSFKPGYWETVFRTNTQSAYMAGKLEKYADTGAVAYQLLVIEDERTSKICRHLLVESGYGAILPVGHSFWKKYGFPPYHFNCRTSVCPIYGSQVAKTGYIVENIPMNRFAKFKPQKGFGGNPLERENWWKMTDDMIKRAKDFGIFELIKEKLIKPKKVDADIVKNGYAKRLRNSFNENTKNYLGKAIQNKSTGLEAFFSSTTQRELRSQLNDSKRNGFTIGEHFEMANQIIDLFENADFVKVHDDVKHENAEIKIERFLSKEKTLRSGKKVKACITVKHSLDKKSRNLYSLEVMDTKKALDQARAKGQPPEG